MGVFKGVGYPEDIGRFYKLDRYKAYQWIAHGQGMIGLNDRIKLRPMTAARDDTTLYIATEESAIREIADLDEVWYPRAGSLFIRDSVGYRAGIHAKAYNEHSPLIVIGGGARDFLGEYMAGGTMVVLRMGDEEVGDYLATGMHGGVIYIRGSIDESLLGEGARSVPVDAADRRRIEEYVAEFCQRFGVGADEVMGEEFVKIIPQSSRPYQDLYTH